MSSRCLSSGSPKRDRPDFDQPRAQAPSVLPGRMSQGAIFRHSFASPRSLASPELRPAVAESKDNVWTAATAPEGESTPDYYGRTRGSKPYHQTLTIRPYSNQ